jgi:hypothetical protein
MPSNARSTRLAVTPPEEDVGMTAALTFTPTATGHRPLGSRSAPPRLQVLPGGRSASPSAAVLWRRRVVVLALATVLVVVTWWGLSAALGSVLGCPAGGTSAPGPAGSVSAPASAPLHPEAAVYVVQEGDTLASIAQRVDPDVPWQQTAQRLVQLNGPSPVQPGASLRLG